MTSASDLKSLRERVEKATGPDREIDADLWLYFIPGTTRRKWSFVHDRTGQTCWVDETRDETHNLVSVPEYTSSIDAALALVERVLPECKWTIEADLCKVRVLTADDVVTYTGVLHGRGGKCTALAIIAALLAALSHTQSEKAG